MKDISLLIEKLNTFEESAREADKALEAKRLARNEAEDIVGAAFDSLVAACSGFAETYSRSKVLNRSLSEFHKKLPETIIMNAPFVRHVYEKPLGYPGDHKAIEMIYKNTPLVNGVAGMIEKSFLSTPASQAVRNRKELLLRTIKDELERKERIKILNLACGPAREIAELASDIEFAGRFSAVNIDADPRSLDYARGLLNGASGQDIKFVRDNAFRIALRKNNVEKYGAQDVIICSGLFDYLDKKWAVKIIRALHSLLKIGGLLVIGNFGPGNPSRVHMEWFANWYLVHRSEEGINELFHRAGIRDVQIIAEPLGINLFGITRRVQTRTV